MVTTKQIFLCVLLIGYQITAFAQQTYRSCYGFDCRKSKWSLSAFAGYQYSGLGNDIKNILEPSVAENVPSSIARCFPIQHRAKLTNELSWNVEAKYALNKKHTLSLALGKLNGHSISGYTEVDEEPFVNFNSATYHASLNYFLKVRRGRDELNIGPVLGLHEMVIHQPGSIQQASSSFTGGLNAGYTLSIIRTDHWFLGFKANYTWLPNAHMGPYTVEHTLNDFVDNTDACTSLVKKSNVHISTLQIGLTTGWRF